ncbi:MAG: hypothetical protein R2850_03435 [Bacteroidia bacterium]
MNFPDLLFEGVSDAPLIESNAVSGGSINDCFHLKLADNQEFF